MSRDNVLTQDDGSEVFRFSLRRLALIVTLIIVAIGFAAIVVRAGVEQARLSRLRSRLPHSFSLLAYGLQVRGGVHEFSKYSERKEWPPKCPTDGEGQPTNSWRLHVADVMLLTDAGVSPWGEPSEPWDSPANRLASRTHGPVFCAIPPYEFTTVFGVTGPYTAFDETFVTKYADLPPDIIVAMEVADSKTHWMQPGDYDVSELLAKSGELGAAVKSHLPDRVHVVFADGEVWALSSNLPMKTLHSFLTIEGATAASRESELEPYRIPIELD